LESIKELTGGESLNANIALIKNNALLGAKIARELHDMKREQQEGF
jgi:pseudouridine-5'-phosphate glycosidase